MIVITNPPTDWMADKVIRCGFLAL